MDSSKYLSEGTVRTIPWFELTPSKRYRTVESKLINKIIVQSLQNVMREGTI